ncbi:MAG: hypothetical protein ACREJ3_12270 [Polyangiaceae bacterium]
MVIPRARLSQVMTAACAIAFCAIGSGCSGTTASGARYPGREAGCPVLPLPGAPKTPVDELGTVTVDCVMAGGTCQRRLLDAVCKRGGDIAWGLGDNTLSTDHPVAHAAHTRSATKGPRPQGCPVQVFTDVAPMRTENIGPVTATCSRDDSEEACTRELEDQVCQLGGDVMWQVDGPFPEGDHQRMRGRAAHTR